MALSSKNETLSDAYRSEQPDKWSDLHPDLIYLITQKLTDIFDFVRFRVVCKRWRSAVQASDLPSQLPWITDNCGSFSKGYLRFYSLLTGKTHTIKVSQSSNKAVTGSAYNYLLTRNWANRRIGECSLFNPLTNEELSLSPTPIEIWHPSCVPSGPCTDPSSRYVVISNHPIGEFTYLYFCRCGNEEWTEIAPVNMLKQFQNSGFSFYDGRCYASDRETGFTKVIDLATSTVLKISEISENLLISGRCKRVEQLLNHQQPQKINFGLKAKAAEPAYGEKKVAMHIIYHFKNKLGNSKFCTTPPSANHEEFRMIISRTIQ